MATDSMVNAITDRKKMSKPVTTATTHRAKTSKCVRLDDRKGFAYKVNKTKFQCRKRRELYYFFVKCYEKKLRKESPDSVANKAKFREFRRFLVDLTPLPEDFEVFTDKKKRKTLEKLFDELEDKAAAALDLERNQDIGMPVNNSEIIPRDEGQAPHGRPPPNPCVHPYKSYQCDCELGSLELRASKFPDLLAELENFREKLNEREVSEWLKDDSNVHLRARREEIYEQLEGDLN